MTIEKLNQQLERLKNISKKPLLKGALVLQKYSVKNAPRKTGFLRSSHSSRETETGAELIVSAEYAAYVEFGTEKWAGKPFLRKAIDEHMNEIVEAVARAVEKELQEKI